MSKMLRTHVWVLLFRLLLLIAAFIFMFVDVDILLFTDFFTPGLERFFLWLIWFHLVFDMLFRLIPNKIITVGARKHFPKESATPPFNDANKKKLHRGALFSFLGWFLCTAVLLVVLYFFGVLTPRVVLIISLIYAVLDSLFILFFCPFQALFMKNHCCNTCRIYNWDYLMMCMPLVLFPSFFSISLAGLSLLVFLQWEWAVIKRPAQFLPETNPDLTCGNCTDKICKLR